MRWGHFSMHEDQMKASLAPNSEENNPRQRGEGSCSDDPLKQEIRGTHAWKR